MKKKGGHRQEPEQHTLLEAFEWLYSQSGDSGLTDEFMEQVEPVTSFICSRLNITPRQAVLLSVIMPETVMSGHCITSDISNYLGCNAYGFLEMSNELNRLRRARYVTVFSKGAMPCYSANADFLVALQKNRPMMPHNMDNLNFRDMFAEVRYIIKSACGQCSSADLDDLCDEIRELFSHNLHLDFCRQADALVHGSNAEFMTLVYFCSHLVNFGEESISIHESSLDDLLGGRELYSLGSSLKDGSAGLIEDGLLEPCTKSGLNEDTYRVTDKVRNELLSEYVPMTATMNDGLIRPESIVPKQLFYNPEIQKQMDTIGNMLSQDGYDAVVSRLRKAGLRSGVAVLLSGPAGTGKTESVLQLARKSGRPIMKVDVADVKDKFVGESEKHCKAIWTAYNKLVQERKVAPILFLNEADQILGKRLEKVGGSADQMNNSIQNIMLENIEQMEGILICTTNLAGNLDSAFERRFLYRVELERPTVQARFAIWKSMIPGMDDSMAMSLAEQYDLSGGQVENISRKLLIDEAITGRTDNSMETYRQYCLQELSGKNSRNNRKIGFN